MKKVINEMKDMINEIKTIINENYNAKVCGWTEQRSEGNYYDVFFDGCECGASSILYEIGCILGMDLKEPDEPDYE